MIHAIDFRGVQKALHVFAETKNRRPFFGCVTPDAFKDTGTVVQNMRHHMHARVVPFDELAVVPDYVADARSGHVFSFAAGWKHVLILLWRLRIPNARHVFGLIDKARYSKDERVCKMSFGENKAAFRVRVFSAR